MKNNTITHKNYWWAAFLVILTALGGLSGCQKAGGEQAGSERSAPEVGTVTIFPREVELISELPGRISAYRMAEIRPQVNGIILQQQFTEGTHVNAGQLLYRIDPAPFQAAYDSARASLEMAKANLPSIRSRAERYRELLADKAVSQQDYDDAAAALNQVLAEIEYGRAAVEKARIDLDYTRVAAPISGRIGKSSVTEGALVTAYQPLALATVQQLDPAYVDVTQSADELLRLKRHLAAGRLSADQKDTKKVQILLENGDRYPLKGMLQFRDVTVEPSTGSYTLRIVVPNPDHLLLPGMFVRAVITEGVVGDAMLAPQQAVSRTPKGEPEVLVVDPSGTVRQKILQVERAIGNQWLVSKGLSPGDRVIIEGRQNVRPGVRVSAVAVDATTRPQPENNDDGGS